MSHQQQAAPKGHFLRAATIPYQTFSSVFWSALKASAGAGLGMTQYESSPDYMSIISET